MSLLRHLRLCRNARAPVVIVVTQGSDGRFAYCQQQHAALLKPLPGEFDTVEKTLDAIRADASIPSGSRVELDEPFMVRR